jgi:FlaA1/EpsC-like NDP-sugar epimerase
MDNKFKDKIILITGVCGTVGSALLQRLIDEGAKKIIGIDNDESNLFALEQKYSSVEFVHLYFADLRDYMTLVEKFQNVDIVFHSGALKHVSICERSPRDAIYTNALGTQNVIDAAFAAGVKRVLFNSSDKAVNPTNVMGTTKLLAERLMTSAHASGRRKGPIFASTRFGNVLGSSGSVIPIFKRQIAEGGPVTLTDKNMTRFIMTLEEAISLNLEAVFMAKGGEVFVMKMSVVRIEDLAYVMINELAPRYGYRQEQIAVDIVGPSPGEKMFEELLNEEEIRHTVETSRFFILIPALRSLYHDIRYTYPDIISESVDRPFNSASEPSISRGALKEYLVKNGLFD